MFNPPPQGPPWADHPRTTSFPSPVFALPWAKISRRSRHPALRYPQPYKQKKQTNKNSKLDITPNATLYGEIITRTLLLMMMMMMMMMTMVLVLSCTPRVRFNPLISTLKPQSNGPLYSNTVIGTLAVDGWVVPTQAPLCCTKCNNPPINGQYINFVRRGTTITCAH